MSARLNSAPATLPIASTTCTTTLCCPVVNTVGDHFGAILYVADSTGKAISYTSAALRVGRVVST